MTAVKSYILNHPEVKYLLVMNEPNLTDQANKTPEQAAQKVDMVNICETRADVFRYAWFIGRGNLPDNKYTYLFNPSPGDLNDLG